MPRPPAQAKNKKSFSLVFLVLFVIFVFSFLCIFSSGALDSEDGWLYASVSRNIYYHHQVASAPDEYPDLNVHMNTTKGADGVWRAPGSIGYSVAMVPAIFLSDQLHRWYGATPPQHFPLQQDWSFQLFASFTNCFFGAILALFILLYAREWGFSARDSVIISLLTLVTTNLLPLTKYSFAHLMFDAFLVGSFYFVKRFSRTQKIRYLVLGALSYLLVMSSYNVSYYVPIIPLGIYLLLLETPAQRRWTIMAGLAGIAGMGIFARTKLIDAVLMLKVSPKILFEGVWGFLFSAGKSMFLYSPPLLLIPIFWHKLKNKNRAELIATLLLSVFYLYFLGSASMVKFDYKVPIWHGGMVWGPRYVSALLPFLMLVVFQIIKRLSSVQKKFIVVPLFILGIGVQIVGVSISYLLQYRDIPYNFFIGKTEVTVYDYASFIPRYTPLYTSTKEVLNKIKTFPQTIAHGPYQVKFFDGFDVPYQPQPGVTIRGFRQVGYISMIGSQRQPLKNLELSLLNVPDSSASSQVAHVSINDNAQTLQKIDLPVWQDVTIKVPIPQETATIRNDISLVATHSAKLAVPQVVYIKSLKVNGQIVNLASLDYPDVSTLGPKTTSIPYHYYGQTLTDPWALWNLRARITERTLDFWWIKNLYYWDRPQALIWSLFGLNLLVTGLTGGWLLKKTQTLK